MQLCSKSHSKMLWRTSWLFMCHYSDNTQLLLKLWTSTKYFYFHVDALSEDKSPVQHFQTVGPSTTLPWTARRLANDRTSGNAGQQVRLMRLSQCWDVSIWKHDSFPDKLPRPNSLTKMGSIIDLRLKEKLLTPSQWCWTTISIFFTELPKDLPNDISPNEPKILFIVRT